MTPNQVLGNVMTDDTYRDDDVKKEKNKEKKRTKKIKEKKEEKKDEKKKTVAFKAGSSSKCKGVGIS
jgi:hypothetical protein